MPVSIPQTLTLDEDGFTLVPPGLQAVIETSLERFTAPDPQTNPLPSGHRLVVPNPVDLDVFKGLFRTIGEPWLWYGRLQKSDEAIACILTAQRRRCATCTTRQARLLACSRRNSRAMTRLR